MANQPAAKGAAKPSGEGFFAKTLRFIKEAYMETRYKASWPSAKELRSFTLVVIFALIVVSVYIGGLDWLLAKIAERVISAKSAG